MHEFDLEIRQGEPFDLTVSLKNGTGAPINLSNCSGKAQIRPKKNSSVLTAEMTVTINETRGLITLTMTPERTKAIPVGTYFYDVCTKNGSVIKYYVGGKFVVKPSVTMVTG